MTSLDPSTPAPAAPAETGPLPAAPRPMPSVLLRGWLSFAVTVVAVLGGSAPQIVSRPEHWSAQAIIAFVPVGERPISAVSATLMVPRYVAYASSPYVVRQAAAAVGVTAPELQDGLTVTMPATTANVSVSVSAGTPAVAADAANRIAALVIDRASVDPLLGGRLLAAAPVPATPAGPSQSTLLAGATAAAVALGMLVALGVRWYTRRRYLLANRDARQAAGPRPAPGGGSVTGPGPHPAPAGYPTPADLPSPAEFPSAADERLWRRNSGTVVLADTIEMPALDR